MSRVFVTTEECYRKKGYHEFIPPEPIFTAEELVKVLNSCAEPGDRIKRYIFTPLQENV